MSLLILLGFILGTVLGSLVQALVERSIKNLPFTGRSYCNKCRKTLKWYDLFPVISFLILKGRCRYCHTAIPKTYPIGEIVIGILTAILFITVNLESALLGKIEIVLFVDLFFKLYVIVILCIVFLQDFKTGLILDRITYPSIIISFLYVIASHAITSWQFYQEVTTSPLGRYLLPPHSTYFQDVLIRDWFGAVGSILTALSLAGIFVLLILITKGKGMGWGDVKYVLFLGLALGFPNSIIGVFMAFLLGSAVAIILIIKGKKKFGQTVPFGPFLSVGAYIALLWGNLIWNWYLTLSPTL